MRTKICSERKDKATVLCCYLWKSEQPFLDYLGQDHQDSLPPSLLYLSPQDLALTQWQPVGTTFLSQTYALTDDSFMVFLSRMRSYSKARSARKWKLTQINLKRNTQLSFWFHTFIWKVKWWLNSEESQKESSSESLWQCLRELLPSFQPFEYHHQITAYNFCSSSYF